MEGQAEDGAATPAKEGASPAPAAKVEGGAPTKAEGGGDGGASKGGGKVYLLVGSRSVSENFL